jgi:hypothetical protein
MLRVSLWLVCAVLLCGSLCASTADAQFLSGGGYGLGFFNYGNTGVYMERIPYYALYPPVYYSYIVPRPYGYSPFAYPPGTMTPDIKPSVAPAEYINPFVPKPAVPASDKTVRAGKPVRVAQTYLNPFVDQSRTASKDVLTGRLDE